MFLYYQQGDNFFDDPVGYALKHQSAQQPPGALENMAAGDFNYYQNNIQPLQQDLVNKALNPQTITNAVSQAETDVNQQFDKAPAAFQRQMAAQGVVPSAAQQQDFNKQQALNRGIATAGAANQARATAASQVSGILRGGN